MTFVVQFDIDQKNILKIQLNGKRKVSGFQFFDSKTFSTRSMFLLR